MCAEHRESWEHSNNNKSLAPCLGVSCLRRGRLWFSFRAVVQQQQHRAGARAAARAMSTDKQITVPFTKDIDTHNCEFASCLTPAPQLALARPELGAAAVVWKLLGRLAHHN